MSSAFVVPSELLYNITTAFPLEVTLHVVPISHQSRLLHCDLVSRRRRTFAHDYTLETIVHYQRGVLGESM
jgi:hypothetical protein